jgi:hypothetical protein
MIVMAGLDPAIHVFVVKESKTWITGTSPVMTRDKNAGADHPLRRFHLKRCVLTPR